MNKFDKHKVFIHESIKTRVETHWRRLWRRLCHVFIHESIKTRVETNPGNTRRDRARLSLSMNPLKQGLKRENVGRL